MFAQSMDGNDVEEIQEFFDQAVAGLCVYRYHCCFCCSLHLVMQGRARD
jgi:hypothetical protein